MTRSNEHRRPFSSGFFLIRLLCLTIAAACGEGQNAAESPEPVTRSATVVSAFDFEDGLLKHYLVAQDALARDQLYEAQAALATLSSFAGYSDSGLQSIVDEAVWTNDVKAVRRAFEQISEVLIAMELPEGYRLAYCPMAFNYEGARWIQAEGEIMNPYYGASMQNCGAFEEEGEEGSTP